MDVDTTADTDIGSDSDADSTVGIWCDESSGRCWLEQPPGDMMDWWGAFHYCTDLVYEGYSDWRLPDISELIGLIRGCVDGNAIWGLEHSSCAMTPGGCVANDNCSGASGCAHCPLSSGPGVDGCYWDPSLAGECRAYWSASRYGGEAVNAWVVAFNKGDVEYVYQHAHRHVRCVRQGT